MNSTKAMIIHQILKLDKPFKPRHIYEEIGISAQNTSNHLARMVSKGILIKNGPIHMVANKEALIDELIASNENTEMEPATDVMELEFFSILQNMVDQVVRARVLDTNEAIDAHVLMNHVIDDAMDECKKLKKWLNHKTYTISRAEKDYNEDMFNFILQVLTKKQVEAR